MTLPIQKDTSRYAMSAKIVECLADGSAGATALGYVAPTADGAAAQAAANTAGANEFWVTAVGDAKPRTADNLGTKYPIISEQLYTAIQLALSGGATPTDALDGGAGGCSKEHRLSAVDRHLFTNVYASQEVDDDRTSLAALSEQLSSTAQLGRRRRKPSPPHLKTVTARTAARNAQLAAWAFLTPGAHLHARVLRVAAAPQPRPELPRLHARLVHHGQRGVHRVRQLREDLHRSRIPHGTAEHRSSSSRCRSYSSTRSALRLRCSSTATSRSRPRCARSSWCRGCFRCSSPPLCGRG